MTKKMKRILDQLEDSSASSALAVRDHLETVASNGAEYATDEAMLCESTSLKEWAEMVIEQLGKEEEVK